MTEPRKWPPGTVAPADATLYELSLHVLLWGSLVVAALHANGPSPTWGDGPSDRDQRESGA